MGQIALEFGRGLTHLFDLEPKSGTELPSSMDRTQLSRGLLLGLLAGSVLSLVMGYGSVILAAGFVDHPLEEVPWMLGTLLPPFLGAGIYFGRTGWRASTRSGWVEAVAVAGLGSLFACVVTAPLATVLTVPGISLNYPGYLTWAPIYALLALPISAPLARYLGQWIRIPLRAE